MKHPTTINCFFTLLFFFTISCSTVTNVSVSNINDDAALHSGSFIYALPLTVVDVEIVADEVTVIPGPYEKFAEKYLGIKHAPAKTEKNYSIKSVTLRNHLEADPDFLYTVRGISDPAGFVGLKDLITDKLILNVNGFTQQQAWNYSYPAKTNEPVFTDLSVKRNFEAEKDIEISMVMPDTNYVNRPSGRNALKEKTTEQKAEEAANFLIKLKKRRFKLVAGQYDYMPAGEAMSEALRELERIEDEYLSLFIGKRTVNQISKTFHYIPVIGKNSNRTVLCRFSSTNGFIDDAETSGIPVMLELEARNLTRELEDYKVPLKLNGNVIPYRIPDQVYMKLMAGEQTWAEAMMPVFQYGVNVTRNLAQ